MSENVSIADCQIPERHHDGHKGTFGRALIVAGSDGMSGAACLAGKATLRGGAGLVTVMVPKCVQAIVAGYEPGYMTVGFEATERSFEDVLLGEDGDVADLLKRHGGNQDVIAIGPGLGTSAEAGQLVKCAVTESPCPVILDADALNLCADENFLATFATDEASELSAVVTPHPGEFARLTGEPIADIQAHRVSSAVQFAKRHHLVVVLKGPQTIVADAGRVYVNETGNSGMATGGSGDVLTGLLAAVIAQGVPLYDAACVAVWLHGAAGDFAAETFSREAMIASDLPQHFGQAWRKLRSLKS
ncbi:MAG: NAD(P)H-hydrate dehydratase [Fuerstiella sp.]